MLLANELRAPAIGYHGATRMRRRPLVVPMAVSSAQPNAVAKEMERVAAKEALLLAIKDAGGLGTIALGKEKERASIEVYEKLLALERLNPTPRPTTSTLLEGLWKFEWAAAQSPILFGSNLLKNLPSSLLSSPTFTLLVIDGSAKATYNLKVLDTIDASFVLTANLSVEGPMRLKEQYIDALLATPVIPEGSVPSQFRGLYDQLQSAVERLPESLREPLSTGLKVPLGGRFDRLLLISYLDEELMVGRDAMGAPDVLTKIESRTEVIVDAVVAEYQS